MDKELQSLFGKINKQFGDNTVQFLSEGRPEIKSYSSGSLTLDLALGLGGIPRGRIVEIFGESMSGKTTVCMLHLAQIQQEIAASGEQHYVAFVDAEHAFNFDLAEQYGMDIDKLVYINPKTAENAIDTIEALVRSGKFRAIVVDSVSALTPNAISESSMEQQTMALLARLMSTAMMKLNGPAYNFDCSVIFINQVREKVGAFSSYGTPVTTSGGKALPFYSSVRLNIKKADPIKDKDEVIGHVVKAKVVKNKVGVPFKEAAFNLIYGVGVDKLDEISQIAVLAGIIEQAGAWFRYKDGDGNIVVDNGIEYKWQGRNAMVEFIKNNPQFAFELEQRIRGIEVEAPIGAPVDEDGYGTLEQEA